MPQQDKTGPMGMGPATGKGMGICGGGKGTRMGLGRGCGMGLRRRFNALSGAEKKELLKTEIAGLKQELQMAEEELKDLEK